MLDIIFALLISIVFFIPQISIRFSLMGLPLEIGFVTLMVIYVGFSYTLGRGLISVLLISFIAETYSMVPHGSLMIANVILFLSIQILLDEVLAEAYVSKSLWVIVYSFISHILIGFVFEPRFAFLGEGSFWIGAIIQSGINGVLSFPLFMLLDFIYDRWNLLFSRKRAHLTGADLYQVKSKQRKYF